MGSGKSSVIGYLEKKGYPVFRADVQAKKFLHPKSSCYVDLKKIFPSEELVDSKGEFDRQKLAQVIFRDPKKKKALEAFIHPLVQKALKEFINVQKEKNYKLLFYEAPLISKKLFNRFDKSILLTCPEHIKKSRLIKKGWKESELKERWMTQIFDSEALDKADFIIDNQKDLKNTYRQVEEALERIKAYRLDKFQFLQFISKKF